MVKMLMSNPRKKFVPLDCPVCSLLFRDLNDSLQYLESGCCIACWVGFVEPLQKLRKDDGYIPTRQEINDWKKKIRKHN